MNDCKIQVKYTKIMININNNTINLICNVILSVDNTNIITRKAIVFLVLENLRSVMLNDKGPWPI